ncbi:MAG: SDR family oxidoreductase, partial [Deltaproteobacteria bacterium]|nr:SDR family oxidoreductase [Deltaproteobacteria bacterium]
GDEASICALVERAGNKIGPIDLFCSNAGIGFFGGIEVANEDWQKIWDVNVMAHVYAARAVLPSMLERGEGYLLNTASAAGLLTQIDSACYSATKHAAVGFAEWLAVTYGDRGIAVSVLCPQAVRTAMTADFENGGVAGVDGMIEPEEVADCTIEAIGEERFLILPHPTVEKYLQNKVSGYDRWLAGMRRLRARFQSS